MTQNGMNAAQLRALAELVCTIRPEWDLPGVLANLAKVGQDATTTATRAIAAANNPAAHTPAAIAWPPAADAPLERSHGGRSAPCWVCTRTEWACYKAQENTGLDAHPYTPVQPPIPAQTVAVVQYVGVQSELTDGD